MTNLTDAELTALAIEHYPNPDDPDGCWSCCEAWVCPTAIALAELRQVRDERKNFDSALEEQMRRGDEYWVENVQLRARNEYLERDGGSLAQRELSKHYESEMHLATAENERLRVAYSELENDVLSQADQIAALQKKLTQGGGQS